MKKVIFLLIGLMMAGAVMAADPVVTFEDAGAGRWRLVIEYDGDATTELPTILPLPGQPIDQEGVYPSVFTLRVSAGLDPVLDAAQTYLDQQVPEGVVVPTQQARIREQLKKLLNRQYRRAMRSAGLAVASTMTPAQIKAALTPTP